jgi:membrane associated rhomboid family serine protease
MFPLFDDNPHAGRSYVTWAIIAVCVLVFLWQATLPEQAAQEAVYVFGMIPAVLFHTLQLPEDIAVVPAWATLVTSMFMHGGLMHLGGNMLYLWIFGDNVEIVLGRMRFLLFYLLCGAAAALTQAVLDPGSRLPLVGASGAISGVLGAYFLLFPRANVRVLMFPFGLVAVPALIVLGLWFLFQLFDGLRGPSGDGGVAFWAHVGGFVAGLALLPLLKPGHVPYFARGHHRPFSIIRKKRDPGDGPWGKHR